MCARRDNRPLDYRALLCGSTGSILDSQVGTSSCCHHEDIDDVNETVELDHDIEGLEEIPIFVEPSYSGSPDTEISIDPLPSSTGNLHDCMLSQLTEPDQKEWAIYYLSKKFTSCEINYIAIKKKCCALVWALHKLWQYMLYYIMWFISCMDPIKYIFEKPALTWKISHWQMLLSKFDIVFVTRKAIKGQAIVEYLADQPLNDPELLESLFFDEDVMALEPEPDNEESWCWKLYFDVATNSTKNGVRAVLVSPKGQ
ncbi:uncharacterized protein LOC136066626 [Quercus suber]|uniref:uncharacterized protein LOC136066626 n=1 Tax=Quercus suber TaxID=58331 RepID=UPI0032DF320B